MIGAQKRLWVSGQVSSVFRPGLAPVYRPFLPLVSAVPSGPWGSYAAVILADSPTAYYRLDETSGTTATDSSGNGHNGTYSGSPTLGVESLIGMDGDYACAFDGIGMSMSIGTVATIATATTAFSFECWFRTGTGSSPEFFSARKSGNGDPIIRFFSAANPGLQVRGDNGSGLLTLFTTGKQCNDGRKHHFVATRSTGKAWVVYIDGVSSATGSDTMTAGVTANDLQFFAHDQTDNHWFGGVIDEAVIYNGVQLSATQVLNHFNAGR